MKTIIIILLLLPIMAFAQTGIYFDAAGGLASQHGLPATTMINANRSTQNHFPAARFDIGYLHDFNSSFGFGFEMGQGFYNKTTYYFLSGEKIKASSNISDFLCVFVWHLKKIDLSGKFGGNRHTIKVSETLNAKGQTDIQPEMMLGINYLITPHFAATLSYLHAFKHHKAAINPADNRWRAPGLNALLAGFKIMFF